MMTTMTTTNSQPLPQGSTLGRGKYTVERVLGQGGFGYVYLAHDRQGQACAIKQCLDLSPAGLMQFGHEGAVQKILDNTTFVRVYAQFVEKVAPATTQPLAESLFTVMEYVPGRSLEELLAERLQQNRGPFPEPAAVGWITQLLTALQHAHAVGVIHRDIKPGNILLLPDGRSVKVIDFGIAKIGGAGAQTLQGARGISPGYSPPEQYAQTGQTGAPSDIYAVGATLYHLLTGQPPVDAPLRLSGQVQASPRHLNPALSTGVEAVILRAMQLDVGGRFQDAVEMLAALQGQPAPAAMPGLPALPVHTLAPGSQAAPRLLVTPREIDWGEVTFRQPPARQLFVENAGAGRLQVQLHAPVPWLQIVPSALALGPQERQPVTVALAPQFIDARGPQRTALAVTAGGHGAEQVPVAVNVNGPVLLSATPRTQLRSLPELIRWCDSHWQDAIGLLRGGELLAAIHYLLKPARSRARRQPAELSQVVFQRVQGASVLADGNLALETVLRALGAEPPAFSHNWREVECRLGMGWRPDLRWCWPWWSGPAAVTFVIRNRGRGYLHGRVEAAAPWLEVRQPAFGCLAGQQQTITLAVKAPRRLCGLSPEILVLHVES